jgi:glycosyltransferase involved in cell wall biosynthesis
MTPKISVLLPVYNNERTIHAAIQSILNQTFSDFELIILNDGSTDGTNNILDKLNDVRIIRLDSKDNIGLPRRLNQGIEFTNGKYIARMDADDISFSDRFQRQVDFLERHEDIDVLGTRAAVMDLNGKFIGLLPFCSSHQDLISCKWQGIPLPHPTWMVRKEWIAKYMYRIPEVWRAEDQELLLRASLHSKYACLSDILLCYYQNKFNFEKSFLARQSLARAQIKYFFGHRDITSVLKVIMVTFARIVMDTFQYLGAEYLIRPYKFSKDLSQDEIKNIYKVWQGKK